MQASISTLAKAAAGAVALLGGALAAGGAAAAWAVNFIPGTYHLSSLGYLSPADETVDVSVSGGVASFTMSGVTAATFSLLDGSAPDKVIYGDDAAYLTSSLISASWPANPYRYLTFWSDNPDDLGGLSIAHYAGANGPLLTTLFTAYDGPSVNDGGGQLFALSGGPAPEPGTWMMALLGLGGLGAALRRRRRARSSLACSRLNLSAAFERRTRGGPEWVEIDSPATRNSAIARACRGVEP